MDNKCSSHQPHGHPCLDAGSHDSVGRIHLPVAPRCNIKCNYCSRKHDCANENRPGVTTRVISPASAIERVREAVIKEPRIKVVGIAGPGDPLDNEATFTTLEMVKKEFPGLLLCLSTNGLLLPEKLDALLEVGLDSLTVTVNTLNENTGAGIYEYIIHKDMLIRGPEASAILRDNQIEGIRRAVNSGIRVKANSVLIRGINENEMVPLSQTLCSLGVTVMNIMPLIPMAKFSHLSPVPAELHQAIRQECSLYIDQISHCRQCRADAVGLLTEELQLENCR